MPCWLCFLCLVSKRSLAKLELDDDPRDEPVRPPTPSVVRRDGRTAEKALTPHINDDVESDTPIEDTRIAAIATRVAVLAVVLLQLRVLLFRDTDIEFIVVSI